MDPSLSAMGSHGQLPFIQPRLRRVEYLGDYPMATRRDNKSATSIVDGDQQDVDQFIDAQEHMSITGGSANFVFDSAEQMDIDNHTTIGFGPAQSFKTADSFDLKRYEESNSFSGTMGTASNNRPSSTFLMQVETGTSGYFQGDPPEEIFTSISRLNDEPVHAVIMNANEETCSSTNQSVADYARDEPYQPEGFARGASTPPPDETPSTGKPLRRASSRDPVAIIHEPNYPHPVKNLSTSIERHQRLHLKFQQLKPNLSLAEHRYWIAVLEHTRRPENVREEKHLVWMRGNRFTTVRTVEHFFQQASMTLDEIVLLHAGIRVKEDVMVQELDLFNDKFVWFRAAHVKSAEAKGRQVTQGLFIEIVELDP